VGAAAVVQGDDAGKMAGGAVTLGGMGTGPVRASELEAALIGQAPDVEFLRQACESCRRFEALDDVHAPASYRQHLATVMSRRAPGKAHAPPARTAINRAPS